MDAGERRVPAGAERYVPGPHSGPPRCQALADPVLVGLSEKEARIAKEKELGVYKEQKVGAHLPFSFRGKPQAGCQRVLRVPILPPIQLVTVRG